MGPYVDCPTTKTVLLENSLEPGTQLGEFTPFSGPQGSRAQDLSALVSHYVGEVLGRGNVALSREGCPRL